MKRSLTFCIFLSLFSLSALAVASPEASTGSAPENNQKYAYYYQFADKSLTSQNTFQAPSELVRVQASKIITAINLLYWNIVKRQLPIAPEPYDRKKHFGDWIVDGRKGNCLNTRAVVLVRESSVKVAMDPNDKCYVQSGNWYDPYSNKRYPAAKDIQIDHFVPLKHAYFSGGFKWDARTKCLYANYLGYRTHLLPVQGTENLKKGDATPYSYLPPNKGFICAYMANWLRVKKIWNLDLIPPETQAIAKAFKENNCKATDFNFSVQELIRQRKFMNDNYRLCENDTGGH